MTGIPGCADPGFMRYKSPIFLKMPNRDAYNRRARAFILLAFIAALNNAAADSASGGGHDVSNSNSYLCEDIAYAGRAIVDAKLHQVPADSVKSALHRVAQQYEGRISLREAGLFIRH
jgi:hypothetical protein